MLSLLTSSRAGSLRFSGGISNCAVHSAAFNAAIRPAGVLLIKAPLASVAPSNRPIAIPGKINGTSSPGQSTARYLQRENASIFIVYPKEMRNCGFQQSGRLHRHRLLCSKAKL
ncbi:MAG: hypothetical protein ACJZ8U_05970 [Paracoccaceae bacterium]